MGNSKQTSDIDCKAKSISTEDDALYLEGQMSVIYYKAAKTWRNREERAKYKKREHKFCFIKMHHGT